MTVKELMEKLAGLPPDMPVMYDDKTTFGLDLAAVSEVCIGLDDENLEVLVIHADVENTVYQAGSGVKTSVSRT